MDEAKLPFEFQFTIGDLSGDGHCESDDFHFRCSHDPTEVVAAYKKATQECQVALHHDPGKGITEVLADYQDTTIGKEEVQRLVAIGVNFDFMQSGFDPDDIGSLAFEAKDVPFLFMEMAKTQLPGLRYDPVEFELPCIHWSGSLRSSLGYGCF